MLRPKLSDAVAALALAAAMAILPPQKTTCAQDADTLDISGTFNMDELHDYEGTVGEDLAEVFARGNEHSWRLTLHGVTYSNDWYQNEWIDEWGYHFSEQLITRVHATSFDFQFSGPDANILNEVVSQQLVSGSTGGDVYLELWNNYFYVAYHDGGYDESWYGTWNLRLLPDDPASGVSFVADGIENFYFPSDLHGLPLVESQRIFSDLTLIDDRRPGNSGALVSIDDAVDISAPEPPYVPPTLSIEDGSVLEGDRGATSLRLIVERSGDASDGAAVNFQTANGTAQSKKDYTAASGIVTFLPGETERKIAVVVKPDRQREPNETFTVRLSNAIGATITDDVATATILNDD